MTSRRCGCLSAVVGALAVAGLAGIIVAGLGAYRAWPFVLAAAAGGAWLGWQVGRDEMRKRRAELRVVARVRKELGLAYERKVPDKRMRRYFCLPRFDTRGWRSFYHVMSGPAGEGSVLLFDYEPTSRQNTPGGTVILFPDVGLPEFELHPRRWWEFRAPPPSRNPRRPDHPALKQFFSVILRMTFGKVKSRRRLLNQQPRDWWDFLGQGVRFDPEELPDEAGRQLLRDFTRSYTVEALEGEGVRRLFSMEKVAFLVGHPGWEAQSYGGHLLLFKGNKKVSLEERPALFREGLALASLFHPPLGTDAGPWAGRAGPSAERIRLKPSQLKDPPHPGPGPSSDERFTSSD